MSEAERLRLCALWHGEHSYQGWSIMLGCEGRRPAETELLCRNVGALVRLRCGFVDFAQAETVKMGGVYGDAFWLRDDQSRSPPHVCGSRRTLRMGRVAIAMSVYPEAVCPRPHLHPWPHAQPSPHPHPHPHSHSEQVGHFVPEHLPKALMLHSVLPAGV